MYTLTKQDKGERLASISLAILIVSLMFLFNLPFVYSGEKDLLQEDVLRKKLFQKKSFLLTLTN